MEDQSHRKIFCSQAGFSRDAKSSLFGRFEVRDVGQLICPQATKSIDRVNENAFHGCGHVNECGRLFLETLVWHHPLI